MKIYIPPTKQIFFEQDKVVAETEQTVLDFNHNVNRSQVIHRFIVSQILSESLVIHVRTISLSYLSFFVVVYFAVVIIYINAKLTKILCTILYAWYIGVFCLFGLVCTGYVSVSL